MRVCYSYFPRSVVNGRLYMKNSKTCSKCNSNNIIRIDGDAIDIYDVPTDI